MKKEALGLEEHFVLVLEHSYLAQLVLLLEQYLDHFISERKEKNIVRNVWKNKNKKKKKRKIENIITLFIKNKNNKKK